jgi:hypothetical protein
MAKTNPIDSAKTLEADVKSYQKKLDTKLKKYQSIPGVNAVDLGEEIGEAYMRAYRKIYGTAFVVKIPRDILAFLYDYVVQNGLEGAAVGLANYNKAELGGINDPYFQPKKENQNAVVIGIWDNNKGIVPYTKNEAQFYDDWNDEWP